MCLMGILHIFVNKSGGVISVVRAATPEKAKKVVEAVIAGGRTIPLRVDTLNNKSVNPRGCFAL